MNKVSIIIPVYNSEKYIAKCLDSVINQTYKEIEILVINDGSTDNSGQIISKYQAKYPNIIKYIEKENSGVAKTRNEGIKIATGKYLMFIDNDDYIDKDYVETFVKEVEAGNYDVVLGGYRRPNSEGKILRKATLKDTEWARLSIIAPWARIYKKDYLIKNDIEFLNNNIGEDIYFNLQAMFLSNKIKIINYIGYNWFFNETSVSNTKQKHLNEIDIFNLLDSSYKIVKSKGILKEHYEIVEMFFLKYIIWFLLYTTKGASKQEIEKMYDKLFAWLQVKFPNYKKNKQIALNKPKGEILSIRIIICGFMFLKKFKLDKSFINFYANMGLKSN